jgi:type III pantothenate kinase
MLLAIEQGNSNTVFAIWDGARWTAAFRLATDAARTAADYAGWVSPMLARAGVGGVDDCIISSVVPDCVSALRAFSHTHLGRRAIVVGEDTRPRLAIRLPDPEHVGVDRLINALGGYRTHGGPLLVVDAGTAFKFDIVARDGAFEGGAIAPGARAASEAMFKNCALAGAMSMDRPDRVIGRSTREAVRSGLYFGYLGLVEGMIVRMRATYPEPLTVIATGGVSAMFDGQIAGVDHHEAKLTLTGLVEVWRDLQGAHARG